MSPIKLAGPSGAASCFGILPTRRASRTPSTPSPTNAVFQTNFISLQLYYPDLAPGEVEFELWSAQATPGLTSVRYTYRATLQGAQDAIGNVVVRRYDTSGNAAVLRSTESIPLTLRRQ